VRASRARAGGGADRAAEHGPTEAEHPEAGVIADYDLTRTASSLSAPRIRGFAPASSFF